MARPRHLPKAPIIEALIDIEVKGRDGLSFEELDQAIDAGAFGYYIKSPITKRSFGITLTQEGLTQTTTLESAQIGLRLHSHDEKYVAQCRLSGFTLSRLPPYEAWPSLIEEARRVWTVYTERLAPVRVSRVATRFINNLQLPMAPGGSYQRYLHKFVDLPNEAPQAVSSFLQRFHLVDGERDAHVNVTLAVDRTPPGERVPVILDIDAFKFIDLEPQNADLWAILEQLRELKNRCFFSTITEAAAELYE